MAKTKPETTPEETTENTDVNPEETETAPEAEKPKRAKKAEKPADPWAETVAVKIPRSRDTKEDVVVSINERTFMIQRGVTVDVPRPVYDALIDQERALEARDAYIEENASE